jgi:hypothetical protein
LALYRGEIFLVRGVKTKKLEDFPYDMGSGFAWFSRFVTKAIIAVEKTVPCTIVPYNKRLYAQWLPHEDISEWDPSPNDVCYGRYLKYSRPLGGDTPKPQTINFWAGLEILKKNIRFSIWIENPVAPAYLSYLKSSHTYIDVVDENSSTDYIIVYLNDDEFQKFCDATTGTSGIPTNTQILYGFMMEIL